jgi:hypothetical protein
MNQFKRAEARVYKFFRCQDKDKTETKLVQLLPSLEYLYKSYSRRDPPYSREGLACIYDRWKSTGRIHRMLLWAQEVKHKGDKE